VFTPDERDRVRDRVLELAASDPRAVAGAVVGGQAHGKGDRWSDIDLTFGVAEGIPLDEILEDWTRVLVDEFDAVRLVDVPYGPSIYRVFLLPGYLQVDLSFAPAAQFGAVGPRFELLFGKAVERDFDPEPEPCDLFGWAVHHAVRARFSIERGRFWQAEYWIAALRHEALFLACVGRGLEGRYARGFDALPVDVLEPFHGALVRSLDRAELLRALDAAVTGLLAEPVAVPELAAKVEGSLRELTTDA
jgi:hypothetical protein